MQTKNEIFSQIRRHQGRCPLRLAYSQYGRDDSDIDVLIDFVPQATIGLFEFIEIQERLSEALGLKVDLLTPQALSKYFRDEVLQEVEPVYDA